MIVEAERRRPIPRADAPVLIPTRICSASSALSRGPGTTPPSMTANIKIIHQVLQPPAETARGCAGPRARQVAPRVFRSRTAAIGPNGLGDHVQERSQSLKIVTRNPLVPTVGGAKQGLIPPDPRQRQTPARPPWSSPEPTGRPLDPAGWAALERSCRPLLESELVGGLLTNLARPPCHRSRDGGVIAGDGRRGGRTRPDGPAGPPLMRRFRAQRAPVPTVPH